MVARGVTTIVSLLHEGYPRGIPRRDYFPLLALLVRSLSDDDVVKVAQAVLRGDDSDPVTPQEVRAAIHVVNGTEPDPEEIDRVAARLASVGWPLPAPAR